MLRLFSLFGRSAAQNAFDDALRAAGVHPLLVPEAVKLTLLRLHRRAGDGTAGYPDSAALLAYCMSGRDAFAEATDAAAADRAEARLEAAIAAGDSFDAQVVLLALHAGLIAPEVAEGFEIEAR